MRNLIQEKDEMKPAKIITSCIHKGGTGKTTVAIHLVHRLAEIGKTVCLVDADSQGNATSSFLGPQDIETGGASLLFDKDADLPEVYSSDDGIVILPADANLAFVDRFGEDAKRVFAEKVRELAYLYSVDYVVIDTPPTIGFGMLAPLVSSDFAFSPIVPDMFALQGVQSLLERINQTKDELNPALSYLGLLVNRLNSRSRDQKDAVQMLKDDLDHYMIPHVVNERASIGRVSFTGQPVWTVKNGAARVAAKEMLSAVDYLIAAMEK